MGRLVRRALCALAVGAVAGCAEAFGGGDLDESLQLYYPFAIQPAEKSGFAWVVNTDFDRRFGRGWLSLFDAHAWAAAAPEQARGALGRGPQVPGLAARLVAGGGRWFLSHRGVGVVTVLDAEAGEVPALNCGARAAGDPPLPTALAASDCDRAHLVDLPQAFVGRPQAPGPRALLDAVALAYLPAAKATPAWPHDRLLVGSLGQTVGGARLVALEIIGGEGGGQATVLDPALDLRMGVGSLLPVAADAADGPPQVIATSFEPSRRLAEPRRSEFTATPAGAQTPGAPRDLDPGLSSGQTSPTDSVGGRPSGALLALDVAQSWGDTVVDANLRLPLVSALGGHEIVALAADPKDPDHLLGLSRGPDALFDLRREGFLSGAGQLGQARRWVQGLLETPLSGSQPQALLVADLPAGVLAVVAGAGDDNLAFIDTATGDVVKRLFLGDRERADQGVAPAGVVHLPMSPALQARGRTLSDILVVTLFYRHALAIVDVSAADPADFALVETVLGADLPPARRYR